MVLKNDVYQNGRNEQLKRMRTWWVTTFERSVAKHFAKEFKMQLGSRICPDLSLILDKYLPSKFLLNTELNLGFIIVITHGYGLGPSHTR